MALTKGRDVNLQAAATSCANELDVEKIVPSAINAEMEQGDIIALANSIDSDYEKVICERFSTFGYTCEYLISKEKITGYYNMLKVIFKHLHYATTLISSQYYLANDNERSSRTSNNNDVCRLLAFFERADVFPLNFRAT